jgi:hypothetical protein
MRFTKALSIMLFVLIGAAGCQTPVAPGGGTTTDTLVASLRQEGASVERMETLPRSAYPFFSTQAVRLQVNGIDVQVFEFTSAAESEANAQRIATTGTPIGTTQIAWVDTPHFYRRDRLIVLYVGRASELMQLLEKVLGPAIIGGRA